MDLIRASSTYLGYLTVAYASYYVVSGALLFLQPSKLGRYLHTTSSKDAKLKVSSWALVTGATDGLGLALADELARSGFNVFLHGRDNEKLKRVETVLSKKHSNRQFRGLILDATGPELEQRMDRMIKELEKYEREDRDQGIAMHMTVLINNLGAGGDDAMLPPTFERSFVSTDRILDANARFPLQITRALYPFLEKNTPSLIINSLSWSSIIPSPYTAIYAGSKGFSQVWSRAVREELTNLGKDIEVIAYLLGPSATRVHGDPKPTIMLPPPARMAKAMLARVGCGREMTSVYLPHAIQFWFLQLLPHSFMVQAYLDAHRPLMEKEKEKLKSRKEPLAADPTKWRYHD